MKKLLTYLTVSLVTLLLTMSWLSNQSSLDSELTSTRLQTILEKVLSLSVFEIQVSQLYEVSQDNLKIADIPIPLTSQKSILVVKGAAMVGVDLKAGEFKVEPNLNRATIVLPYPKILSLDADIRTLHENDFFLNRISVQDRNQTLDRVKRHVRKDLLTPGLTKKAQARIRELLDSWFKLLGVSYKLEFRSTTP